MGSKRQVVSLITKDILHAYKPLPLPPAGSFAGQTVCVVGSSTGLGLAAAHHCLTLGASELIITSRDTARAAAAKKHLEEVAAATGAKCRVSVMVVDMNRYASVVAFTNEVKKVGAGRGGVDFILLNAAVIQSDFVQSPEGWQEELQVNTLSTLLLAMLLLPWLKEERKNRASPAHLAITTSSAALTTDISRWESWSQSGEGVLNHWNKEQNWPTGLSGGYPISKTLLTYGHRELTKLAVDADGRPWVIMNTMDPGMVRTEIQKHVTEKSFFLRTIEPPVTHLLFKTPDNGARILINGGLTTENQHGHLLSRLTAHETYINHPIVASEPGQRLQSIVWTELTDILATAVPEARGSLDELARR